MTQDKSEQTNEPMLDEQDENVDPSQLFQEFINYSYMQLKSARENKSQIDGKHFEVIGRALDKMDMVNDKPTVGPEFLEAAIKARKIADKKPEKKG